MSARKIRRRAYRRQYYTMTQTSYSDFGVHRWRGGLLRQSVEQVERWRQSPEGQRLAALWASADMHIHDEAVFVGTVTGQIGGQGYSQNMQNDEDVVAAEHRVRGFMHKLKMRPFD
jgi:hypothetical protein